MENFEMVVKKYGVTLKVDGNYFSYVFSGDRKERVLVRSEAEVNGYTFELDRASSFHLWKKAGRGGVKQRKEVEAKLVEADSFMVEEGYKFRR